MVGSRRAPTQQQAVRRAISKDHPPLCFRTRADICVRICARRAPGARRAQRRELPATYQDDGLPPPIKPGAPCAQDREPQQRGPVVSASRGPVSVGRRRRTGATGAAARVSPESPQAAQHRPHCFASRERPHARIAVLRAVEGRGAGCPSRGSRRRANSPYYWPDGSNRGAPSGCGSTLGAAVPPRRSAPAAAAAPVARTQKARSPSQIR